MLIHEDAALVAVNKPAGLTVVPARDEPPEASLVRRLEKERGEKLFVVHRLDRDTSGVVVFARTAKAHRALSMAFEARRIAKGYVAFTRGAPTPRRGLVTAPLHPARKGKMRPASPGEAGALEAETAYHVTATFATRQGPLARIEASPHTGRQHQIRVHLRFLEAPLVVDPLYGRCAALEADALGPGSPAISRLTLHAFRLEFDHPTTGAPTRVEAPLADELAALEAWLARSGRPTPIVP